MYFNSIKVRLERMTKHYIDEIPLFQFHKGAIRTLLSLVYVTVAPEFQFHKGAIRTVDRHPQYCSITGISIP